VFGVASEGDLRPGPGQPAASVSERHWQGAWRPGVATDTAADEVLMRDRDFERVILAHGEVLERGGPAALRAGYAWLLDGE
jgi:hypothetical protein